MNQLNSRVSHLEKMKSSAETSENLRIGRSTSFNEALKRRGDLIREDSTFDDGMDVNNVNSNDGLLPESCQDLQKFGHDLKGFYPIKTGDKISLAFCDFASASKQGKL